MGRRPTHDRALIMRLAAEGWSERQIAAQTGAHRNTVHRVLNPAYRERQYAYNRARYAERKGGSDDATS